MICKTIDIWENLEYNEAKEGFRPTLTTYILDELREGQKRGAVVVLPGGGYSHLAKHEGEPVALKFCEKGMNAFVLEYSTAPCKHPQPLRDVARALCIIRDHADEWNIDKEKIAILGFSAGGHLAATSGTMWHKDYLQDVPDMEYGKNKPDAMILCYPVIMSPANGKKAHAGSFYNLLPNGENSAADEFEEVSAELNVSDKTCPAFIWHTFEDGCVPVENSIEMARKMRENDIPCELHIYQWGGHGLSIPSKGIVEKCHEDYHMATWIDLCLQWLDRNGFNRGI